MSIRERIRARLTAFVARASRATGGVLRYKAEILTSVAAVAGWYFLTSAIAALWRPDVVWRFSAGLFFLSLSGWRLLHRIASRGLYKLTRD